MTAVADVPQRRLYSEVRARRNALRSEASPRVLLHEGGHGLARPAAVLFQLRLVEVEPDVVELRRLSSVSATPAASQASQARPPRAPGLCHGRFSDPGGVPAKEPARLRFYRLLLGASHRHQCGMENATTAHFHERVPVILFPSVIDASGRVSACKLPSGTRRVNRRLRGRKRGALPPAVR